jgi:hypothetical protein
MQSNLRYFLAACVLLGIIATACTLPVTANNPDAAGTMVAATIFALQTDAAATQTQLVLQIPTSAATPVPTITLAASITPTPQNPIVTKLALCWTGPGDAYKVVSSVKASTRVPLLCVGSVQGWFVIENPVYHDRCWIEASSLQLDPGIDVGALKVCNPPPTPGPRATITPTP